LNSLLLVPAVAVTAVAFHLGRKLSRYARAGMIAEQPPRGESVSYYYLDHRRAALEPSGPLDRSGVVLVRIKGVPGLQYYPITIAQYALGHYELYLDSGEELHRRAFLRQARWLQLRSDARGDGVVWKHPFRHPFYGMEPGWVSAMAQGQAISVLLRAYLDTGEDSFLETATRAVRAFDLDVGEGGVRRETRGGGCFFEEYPSEPPSFVLNGFLFALWGLYEHALLTGDWRSKRLFGAGMEGLKEMLPLYDLGYWSRYDLFPANERPAAPFYHRIHVRQLSVTGAMTGERLLEEYSVKWRCYESSPLKLGRALAKIVGFKLAGREK